MANIRFFSLGGLGENGKNMYCVEVDKKIFILDTGLKYPNSELYGIDEIIPDFRMLTKVKQHIKGIFLSHAHEDHVGALPHILKELNVPVYGSEFTLEIVKEQLKENDYNLNDYKFVAIKDTSYIKFGDVKVTFFSTNHSIPGSLAIVIMTLDGSIVFTSDFTLMQSGNEMYQTNFRKINEIAEKGVLLLLPESVGAPMEFVSGLKEQLFHRLNNTISRATGRIIVTLFSSDIQKIQNIIDISVANNKKIAVLGRRTQKIVDIAIKNGYLNIPSHLLISLKFIDDKNKNLDPNLVCLITGNRHEPFYMLQRMTRKVDRLINIEQSDTIIMLTPPIPGTEKMAARTLDLLFKTDAEVMIVDRKQLQASHASAEELKMMINFLNPKYIVPVTGEFRQQFACKKCALEIGYKDENVFLLDNGDSLYIEEKVANIAKEDVKTGDILIDGIPIADSNDVVMRDRELLADDGAVIVVASIDPKKRVLLGKIEVSSKGFSNGIEAEETLKNDLTKLSLEIINKHLSAKKYINWNDIKKDLRDVINNYIYKSSRRNPIIIPLMISAELSND